MSFLNSLANFNLALIGIKAALKLWERTQKELDKQKHSGPLVDPATRLARADRSLDEAADRLNATLEKNKQSHEAHELKMRQFDAEIAEHSRRIRAIREELEKEGMPWPGSIPKS